VAELNRAGIPTGILIAPLMPGINDAPEQVERIVAMATEAGAVHIGGNTLFLRGSVRDVFFAWLRAHRPELEPTRTAFVCVDQVGHGTVRYARREGYLLPRAAHSELLALCDQIAEEDAADDTRYGARAYVSRMASDAHAATAAGFPAVAISCLGSLDRAPHHHLPSDTVENVDPSALERAFGFCSELIELIDERLGPELEAPGAA
jgi:hypothetical protein